MSQTRQIPLLSETPDIMKSRSQWRFTGDRKPDFAAAKAPGQESVWDYPRPPALVPCAARLTVFVGEQLIADTQRGARVLETAGAPTYYFPPDDVDHDQIEFGERTSLCEWKGVAQSITVAGNADAAWRYVQMFPAFVELYQWLSFYPSKLDCFVDQEKAHPQPGGYYGGWVTDAIAGPIKGSPGSQSW